MERRKIRGEAEGRPIRRSGKEDRQGLKDRNTGWASRQEKESGGKVHYNTVVVGRCGAGPEGGGGHPHRGGDGAPRGGRGAGGEGRGLAEGIQPLQVQVGGNSMGHFVLGLNCASNKQNL